MELREPVFVGFFPKVTQRTPAWLGVQSVREICSVSNCISDGPEGWIDHWEHNAHGFYDSEEQAQVVAAPNSEEFDLYAYHLFPMRCIGDVLEPVTIESAAAPPPVDYEFLGYDIVTKSVSDFFECSPLSCNYAAREYPVNQYCLIADRDQAYQALQEISRVGTYEPGPYYLFQVYRKRRRA